MLTVTRAMMLEKMESDLKLFSTQKTKLQDGSNREVNSIVYYPNFADFEKLLHPERGDWFSKRSEISAMYATIAKYFHSKVSKDSDATFKQHTVENYVELMRRANLVKRFGVSDGAIQIADLDQHIWENKLLEKQVLKDDFLAIYNNGNHNGKIEDRKNDPDKEKARIEKEKADKALQAKGKFDPKKLPLYIGVTVGLAIVFFLILMAISGNLETIMPSFGSGQTPSNPQITLTQPGIETLPNTTAQPGGTAPLSEFLVETRTVMELTVAMLKEWKFWILIVLCLGITAKVFSDAQDRADKSDFPLWFTTFVGVVIVSFIPVLEFVFPGQTLTYRNGVTQITMGNLQNFILLLLAAGALWGIAKNGVEDYTPLSAGLFVIGVFFFVKNPANFMNWQLPLETVVSWVAAAVIQLIEIGRQHHAKVALLITGAGIVSHFGLFFVLVSVLERSAGPELIQNAQVIAFSVALMLVVLVVNFVLGWLAKQNLGPVSGVLNGNLTNQISTATHDAVLMLLMWGIFFLVKF